MLIAAPLTLSLDRGSLQLGATPDFAAITPATVAAVHGVSGTLARWRLVENRTSFERLARAREASTAVIWLPGYPPGWWRMAMAHLLAPAPACAEIACDPDPAGIAIALEAGQVWEAANLPWQPWHMDPCDLEGLEARHALAPADWDLLTRLLRQPLPARLAALAHWMDQNGKKGEQEGFL